jgi:shikimate kinase
MKYIICGFSGAGKSYILQHLRETASLNSYKCIDLDEYLLENVATSHSQLGNFITTVGWEEFRKQEQKAIYQLLKLDRVIISLGGGTLNNELIEHIKADLNCWGFWLDTPFETCWNRIKDDQNRPLRLEGYEAMHSLFLKRKELYQKFQVVKDALDIVKKVLEQQQ